jgi:hypothetical protein
LLKDSPNQIATIEKNLAIAFAAFDAGEREQGRKAMVEIYNLGLRDLR